MKPFFPFPEIILNMKFEGKFLKVIDLLSTYPVVFLETIEDVFPGKILNEVR